MALTQSQQSSDDYDGELSVAAATSNSHSSQTVAVPVAFLDNAQFECDHTRHAASNAAHSCYGQAVCEDPSAQDNRSVAETADLAEGGTCAQAAACRVTFIKVVAETGRWQRQRRFAIQRLAHLRYRPIRCIRKLPGRSSLPRWRSSPPASPQPRSGDSRHSAARDLDFVRDTLERPCNHEVRFGAGGDPVAKGKSLNH